MIKAKRLTIRQAHAKVKDAHGHGGASLRHPERQISLQKPAHRLNPF
jgi:hypothetical protein